MTERTKMTPEEEREWYALYAECAMLAVLITNRTEMCVFFNFSGHVSWSSVGIRESKTNYQKELASTQINTCVNDPDSYQAASLDSIRATRDRMRGFLEDARVDTTDLPFEDIVETTRYYSF